EFGSSKNTTKAIDLQREHQTVFADRHQRWLSTRHTQDQEALLFARTANNAKRVLFMEDRVPHPWLGSGFPRARSILLSLLKQGFFVTFYPLTQFDEAWS